MILLFLNGKSVKLYCTAAARVLKVLLITYIFNHYRKENPFVILGCLIFKYLLLKFCGFIDIKKTAM